MSCGSPRILHRSQALWPNLCEHTLDNERGRNGHAVVMQQRTQLRLLDSRFERQQRTELGISILLDHEQQLVRGKETLDVLTEGEGAHAHVVDVHVVRLQDIHGLVYGPLAATDRDDADVASGSSIDNGPRNQLLCGVPLQQQPNQHKQKHNRVLGVGTILRVSGAAREVSALRMNTWESAICDAVAFLVDETVKLLEFLHCFCF